MTNATYTRPAIALHWVIALLIFAAFPLGLYMHDLPLSPERIKLYSYHKWMGITVLMLALARVAWRAANRPPAPPAGMSRGQVAAAHAAHGLLYLLIFVAPLSGWLMSSAKGFQTVWFGVVPLPDLVSKDKALGALLEEAHTWLNYGMMAIVGAHAAAALKHHFVVGDDVLARMMPALRRRG